MALIIQLPTELLAHIFHLSTEGEWIGYWQPNRIRFGLVARAFYLATAHATEFHVEGDTQIKAFIAKLEREKKEEHKSKSGRTTRATALATTRVSRVRHLRVSVHAMDSPKVFFALLHATPDLVALDLIFASHLRSTWSNLPEIKPLLSALSELTSLRKLKVDARSLKPDEYFQLLASLEALEELDLYVICNEKASFDLSLLARISMPCLRKLKTGPLGGPTSMHVALFQALASRSTVGLRSLDISITHTRDFDLLGPSLFPFVATLVDFSWSPFREPFVAADRDAVLALISGMTSLNILSLHMWTLGDRNVFFRKVYNEDKSDFGTDVVLDSTLVETLATLPHLRSVDLKAFMGVLDRDKVRDFIEKAPALTHIAITGRVSDRWTTREESSLRNAAREAGVILSYKATAEEHL